MKLEKVKLDTLKPLEKNTRIHTQEQVKEIYKSYKRFSQIKNMVVGKNNVILIGNGLYRALVENGEKEAYILRREDLSNAEEHILSIADNRIYELGITDSEELYDILNELKKQDKLDIPGYSKELLDSLFANSEEVMNQINEYGDIGEEKENELSENDKKINKYMEEGGMGEIRLTNKDIQVEEDELGQKSAYIICKNCGEKIWL